MSNIPAGYKQTEVGVIPEDWEVKMLEEGIKLLSGHHVLAQHCNSAGIGVPYITGPADFPEGIIQHTKFTEKPTTLCRANDILVTVKGSGAGTIVLSDAEYCISRQLMAVRVTAWDTDYVYLSLCHDSSLFGAAATGLIPGLSRGDILKKQIAVPPLAEQTAIATALSDADALITSLEKLIAKKRNIKQGAMQELLKPKEGWVVKKLGEIIASMELGGNYANRENVTKYPLIKMGNIGRGRIVLSKLEYITASQAVSEKDRLCHGDVLFNTRNTLELVGKVAIWLDELPRAYFNSNIMRLKFDSKIVISNIYMNCILNQKKQIEQLRGIATGTTSVAAIYTRDLVKIEIPIAPLAEQTRIAAILSDMDAEIEGLEKKLEKYRRIRQGMMQELLTGRIRLI